jgi:rare lipoprotein A
MMTRALKAFPGMVFSMLIAAPAFASGTAAHAARHETTPEPRRTAHAVEHRRPAISRTALASVSRAGGRVTTATRVRRYGRNAPSTTAFVNDATAWSEPGVEVNGAAYGGGAFARGQVMQVGLASWYGGNRWQGHRTSSGARYDEMELTAAHATLPLGSRVLVALAGGGRSVVVTITDRPGTRKRIIDLSRAAAAELGILERGVAQVSLTPL